MKRHERRELIGEGRFGEVPRSRRRETIGGGRRRGERGGAVGVGDRGKRRKKRRRRGLTSLEGPSMTEVGGGRLVGRERRGWKAKQLIATSAQQIMML